jgi:two-component system response regulator
MGTELISKMSGKMILLVEDNPDDEALTLRAFKKNNISNEVVIVRDGEEALEYLFGVGRYQDRDTEIQPQLVLLDLQLPKLDGPEVLRRLRADERTALLPVVILTTSREQQDITKCYASGANGYACKPMAFDEFSEAVKHISLYWLALNETP